MGSFIARQLLRERQEQNDDVLWRMLAESLEICRRRKRADVGDHVLNAMRALYGEKKSASRSEKT